MKGIVSKRIKNYIDWITSLVPEAICGFGTFFIDFLTTLNFGKGGGRADSRVIRSVSRSLVVFRRFYMMESLCAFKGFTGGTGNGL